MSIWVILQIAFAAIKIILEIWQLIKNKPAAEQSQPKAELERIVSDIRAHGHMNQDHKSRLEQLRDRLRSHP